MQCVSSLACAHCACLRLGEQFRFETTKRTEDRSQQLHEQHWEVGTPFSFARSTNSTPPPQLTNAPTRPQRHKSLETFMTAFTEANLRRRKK